MLDTFLLFMQVYLTSKVPMPVDVEFFVNETKETLRPEMVFASTYPEAVAAFNQRILDEQERMKVQPAVVEQDSDNEERKVKAEDELSSEDEPSDGEDAGQESPISPNENCEAGDLGETVEPGDEKQNEGEETFIDSDEEQAIDPAELELDQEFERQFSMMMQESMDSRRNDKKAATFDAPIPMKFKSAAQATAQTSGDAESPKPQKSDGSIAFTLLTKRGNKQQGKTMELPSDSSFVRSTLSKRRQEQEERTQLKEIVLNYGEQEWYPEPTDPILTHYETTNATEIREPVGGNRGRGRGRRRVWNVPTSFT